MALDFSNRNGQDPNGIYSLDTSGAQPAWVNDDWTVGPIYDQAEARKAGATNQVRVAVAITNDGKKYNVVLGSNGQPISQIGDVIGQDDDVSRRWQQNGPRAQPPGASPTQTRNGRIYGYNPQTGLYDIDQGVAPTTGTKPAIPPGGSSVTEGTPDPSKPGGWDNQRPRQVIRDKDGNVVWSEELTGADLTAWRNQQQASQPQTKREPDKEHPGLTIVTTVQGGQTETHYEDANGNRVAAPGKEPSVQLVTINGQPGYQVRTTPGAAGQPPKIEWFDPSGKPLAQPPVQAGQPHTEVVTISGQRYTTVTTANPDGTIGIKNYGPDGKEIAQLPDQPSKDGFPSSVPGEPEPELTVGSLTTGLQKYSAWLSQQVKLYKDSGGKQGVSPDDASKLMDRRISLAEAAIREQQGTTTTQTTLLGNATTQRGQTMQDTASRRAAATGFQQNTLNLLFPLASKLGPGGGALLNQAINDTLASGLTYAGQWGGLRESPEVSVDAFPALAAARRAGQAGIQTAAQGGPQMFASNPPTGGAAPVPDPAAIEAARRQQIMANPLFRPQPVTPAVTQTDPQAQAQPAVDTPPYANPVTGEPIAFKPLQDTMASIQMPGVEPSAGGLPMPSQQQFAAMLARGSQGQQGGPAVYDGVPLRGVQEARFGAGNYWQPDVHGQAVAQRLGIDPDIFKQAVAGLYGQGNAA